MDTANDIDEVSNNRITCGEETLYHLLFSDSATPQTKSSNSSINNFNSYNQQHLDENSRKKLDDSYLYLQELNSYHIDRLQLEPAVLLDKKQHLQDEIKNLAFSNYKTFIRTAQCSREIYSDFSIIESKLDQLITKLPEFGSMCDNFTKIIQIINTSRRTNNLTLQKHNQLLEILEISQLMDTCVRNEYYEEALDLAAYVKRLDKKFSATIPLIKQIVDDVNHSLNLMLKQLLQQLKTNLQFNQCLKIIGIIRRLDVFTESELRVKFLQLRDSWLQSLISNIPQTDPYQHITKTIEEYRIHLFDIITQYRAIFSDDNESNDITKSVLLSQKDLNESKLFYCWLQHKIKNFLAILSTDLKQGVGNRLDSVLSQSMYFGLAFSRVGLDFRALMVPIFEESIMEQFKKQADQANLKFEESLLKLNWSELFMETNLNKNDLFSLNKDLNSKLNQTTLVSPPISLMEFQPLAIYLNCLLQTFNEFRLCAPLSLFSQVAESIRESLGKIGLFCDQFYKKEKTNFDASELQLFKNFLQQLAYELVPFLEQCLFVLFPVGQLQKVLSVPQNELSKLKKCLSLNVDTIFMELKELIPVPVNEPEIKEEEQQLTTNQLSEITEKTKDELNESSEVELQPELNVNNSDYVLNNNEENVEKNIEVSNEMVKDDKQTDDLNLD